MQHPGPAVAERVQSVRRRIARAAARAGRDPAEIVLVGASKRQPVEVLRDAWRAGLRVFGENRVQEAAKKAPALPADIEWHLIGPLQTNKVRRALELFTVVHSVDRARIAEALSTRALPMGRRVDCFVEVNLGEEASKHGFHPAELPEALEHLAGLAGLVLRGLMAIPPAGRSPEDSRPWFRRLAALRDAARSSLGPRFAGELSMGMSDDFEVAIEEGATHVRVGTALFGPRPSSRPSGSAAA